MENRVWGVVRVQRRARTPQFAWGGGRGCLFRLGEPVEFQKLAHEPLQGRYRQHVRSVGRGVIRVLMRFDEDRRHPNGHRRAREHRHEAPLAAAGRAAPARLLHGMGGVEHHRATGLGQNGQRAHVGDERVIAEAHPALGDEHIRIARLRAPWPRRSSCPRARGIGPS